MQLPGCNDNTLAADCESLGYCPVRLQHNFNAKKGKRITPFAFS